jgi:AraC-like DNA-binding protein
VLGRDTWDAPLQFRDDGLSETLLAHADRSLRELQAKPPMTTRLREALMPELRGGDPSIETAAKRLAMTPRTIQRHLKDEETSFQDILDGLRAELADRYLSEATISVTEVAFLLGYAEASSFARAYKRWTGKSPTEQRVARN